MLRRPTAPRLAALAAGLVVAAGLTVTGAVPSAAALDSPSGLSASAARIPVLTWTRVPDATAYDVQLSRTADFSTTLATASTVNTAYVPVVELPVGEVWWRVRAKSGSAVTEWTGSSVDRANAAAPVPVRPESGQAFTPPTTPLFSWQPVAGATSYTVQTSTDPAFTDPALVAENKQRTTAAYLTTYPGVGEYYWRVSAELSTGYRTSWSTPLRYVVDGLPAVVRTSPADVFDKDHDEDGDGVNVGDAYLTDVVLDWEPVPGAATYELRIDTDRNFLSVDHAVSGITGTRYSPPGNLKNDDFYWQVRAVTASGRPAPWQDTQPPHVPWRFTHAWPAQPEPRYPVGPTTPGVPFFFEWAPVERASSYVVHLFDADGAEVCETAPTIHTTIADQGCRPPTSGTWSWRVEGFDEGGTRLPTVDRLQDRVAFTYEKPAAQPATSDPLPAATGQAASLSGTTAFGIGTPQERCDDVVPDQCDDLRQTPVLTWDPVPGAASYRLVITNDAEGTNPHAVVSGLTQPMWTPEDSFPDSQAGSAYYWQVQPCNSRGCWTGGSPRHAFAKESVAPAPRSPRGAVEVADEVTLEWGSLLDRLDDPDALAGSDLTTPATTDAKQYVVQTSVVPSFASVIESRTVEQTSFTSFTTTYPEGPVFWRVGAFDGSGRQTVWSEPQQLVKRSPSPVLTTPSDGAALGQDSTLSWLPLPYAKTYEVEVYSGPTKVAGGTTVHTSWAPSDPFPASATAYNWRVRRLDAVGRTGEWSALRTFRNEGFTPAQATPAAGGVVPPSGALFTWEPDARATSYRFERRKPGSASDVAETVTTRATAWAPTTALAAGTAQWRVTALDSAGKALGSSPWRDVVVVDPPAEVNPVTVTGSGRIGSDLRLAQPTFDPPVDATTYQWYRGTSAITGATGESYTLVAADLGKSITVRATGRLAGYKSATSTSNAVVGVVGDEPVSTAPPTLEGTPAVGETLTVVPGTWSEAPSLRYQWFRDGAPISGADDPTYRLVAADAGRSVHVVETATLSGRTPGTAASDPVVVELGAAPVASAVPVLTGTPVVGQTLRVTSGTWPDRPSVRRQWYRDDAAIGAATGTSYTLVDADAGHEVRVVETAVLAGRHDGSAASEPMAVRPMPVLEATSPPRVSGTPRVGEQLTADPGTWSGTGSPRFTYQWLRDGVAVGEVSSRSSYTVTAADAARRISVLVRATSSGFAPGEATSTAVAVARMRSTTTLALSATRAPARQRVTLTAQVSVSGAGTPGGTVTVHDGNRRLTAKRVGSSGSVTYRLPRLSPGRHTIKVTYAGTTQVAPSSRSVRLTVTRR
jgi:large repetitive protein